MTSEQQKTDILQRMADCLRKCSTDLKSEIDVRYRGFQYVYPAEKSQYDLDTAPITEAKKLLEELDHYDQN